MEHDRVLIIEDDKDVSYLIQQYLLKESFEVEMTKSGYVGLNKLKAFRPHLLLLDIGLPDIDGLSLCKEIRRSSTIPILFLTSRREMRDVILGLDVGGDDYITKPFEPEILVARVIANIRRYRLVSEFTNNSSRLFESLTNREIETLLLLNRGYTNKEIANRLYLSEGTIKGYNHVIFKKLNVKNRTQAITKAREVGIL
ncbi:response regulator transcription factor [Geomicrobium sp. JCM 19038]|uniref:response regulator transcription factor n=1 Tax=Geomicrobium sp. JCM 19038 TaxID=1460635 RepID=UPI00045F2721|nr:response regulator transcription factor [Geomicrobium sp. JCM 19038]GAK08391.1 two-component response regulator YycF [Geomicrobium sp. JCM 19038]